jgi:diguanylate cyclase (GGDEF)-like protein
MENRMTRSLAVMHTLHLALALLWVGVTALGGYALFADLPRPDTVALRLGENARAAYVAAFACAAFGVGAIHIRLYRRTSRALRHDIDSLLRLFSDMRDGSVRVNYPMELREFTEIFSSLRRSGKQLVEEKEQLKDLGLIDHLSQLPNRRYFETRLGELFERRQTHGLSSVLLIDLDHFKAVNDSHGHDAGDALISAFAGALRRYVRKTDFVARLGGDEFCIIYPHNPLASSAAFAERLRWELPPEVALPNGAHHALRWTGGLSVMTDADAKFDDVLWRADQALFRAKEGGRNTLRVHDPEFPPEPRQLAVNS